MKEAIEKYERMGREEDQGGRPIHRAREWQKASRSLEKELKTVSWHKGGEGEASAPLIIDPMAGNLTCNLKAACKKYEEATGIRAAVKLRAGHSVRKDAKPEPLRSAECGQEDCLCCSTGHPGSCERKSIGYRITCDACQKDGTWAQYEGESGRNAYTRGLEHHADLRN